MNYNETQQTFLFESVLKRKNHYFISKKTLLEIENGRHIGSYIFPSCLREFNELLDRDKLVVLDVNEELKLIKKV